MSSLCLACCCVPLCAWLAEFGIAWLLCLGFLRILAEREKHVGAVPVGPKISPLNQISPPAGYHVMLATAPPLPRTQESQQKPRKSIPGGTQMAHVMMRLLRVTFKTKKGKRQTKHNKTQNELNNKNEKTSTKTTNGKTLNTERRPHWTTQS